jgi:hypothetical protein
MIEMGQKPIIILELLGRIYLMKKQTVVSIYTGDIINTFDLLWTKLDSNYISTAHVEQILSNIRPLFSSTKLKWQNISSLINYCMAQIMKFELAPEINILYDLMKEKKRKEKKKARSDGTITSLTLWSTYWYCEFRDNVLL